MAQENKTNNIEREYTIPLRREINKVARYRKSEKAIKAIKEFLVRHMKVYDRDVKKIKIDRYVNEGIWHRGIRNPPAKIKVKAIKDSETGIVKVELAEYPNNLKFKKAREEKTEEKSREKKKKKTEKTPSTSEETKTETEEKEKENEEKKEAVIEAGKEAEKASAKTKKHSTKTTSAKQEKNQRIGYNQSSRGH